MPRTKNSESTAAPANVESTATSANTAENEPDQSTRSPRRRNRRRKSNIVDNGTVGELPEESLANESGTQVSMDVSPIRPAGNARPEQGTPAPRSALKQGRYARPSTPAPERMHLHNHKRIIIDASYTFSSDDRFKSFLMALASLLTYARLVDEYFVINPVKENGRDKDWSDPSILPTSMTALGAYIVLSGNTRIFEKARSDAQDKSRKDTRPSAVYFSFAVSSNVPPSEVITRISADWSILGGQRLAIKSLGFFDTCTPIAIYFLWNEGHMPTLLEELKTILNTASTFEADGSTPLLPPMFLRKLIPRIPGQVTEAFNQLSLQAQMARRTWHIEVETQHANRLRELVNIVKTSGAIQSMWGRQVHFSEVADFNTSSADHRRYIKFSQRHVNFHCSMICLDIKGIIHLDATATVYSVTTGAPVGNMSLRKALLKYMKMADGTSLIAEIHQRGPMGKVEVVVPNTSEAETMVAMMDRHFPAYFYHTCLALKIDVKFVKEILKEACCQTLNEQIDSCTWDPETRTITTPEQLNDEARMAEIESAAWYKDEFSHRIINGIKKVKSYTDPEALYNLDSERSVKTLNAKNDTKVSTSSEVVELTKDDNDEEADDDEDDEDEEKDEDYESDDSCSTLEDLSLGSLGSYFVDEKDITMESATSTEINVQPSTEINEQPSPTGETDNVSTVSRVHFSTSNEDESSPVASAGIK